jgi:hypothetical protein
VRVTDYPSFLSLGVPGIRAGMASPNQKGSKRSELPRLERAVADTRNRLSAKLGALPNEVIE